MLVLLYTMQTTVYLLGVNILNYVTYKKEQNTRTEKKKQEQNGTFTKGNLCPQNDRQPKQESQKNPTEKQITTSIYTMTLKHMYEHCK